MCALQEGLNTVPKACSAKLQNFSKKHEQKEANTQWHREESFRYGSIQLGPVSYIVSFDCSFVYNPQLVCWTMPSLSKSTQRL
jgi:hypothetical protein